MLEADVKTRLKGFVYHCFPLFMAHLMVFTCEVFYFTFIGDFYEEVVGESVINSDLWLRRDSKSIYATTRGIRTLRLSVTTLPLWIYYTTTFWRLLFSTEIHIERFTKLDSQAERGEVSTGHYYMCCPLLRDSCTTSTWCYIWYNLRRVRFSVN